ncbi:MAG: terminase large subunit domain-containing protein [Christensenellales bacterium]|jgi:phage terminase large subunit-like protein
MDIRNSLMLNVKQLIDIKNELIKKNRAANLDNYNKGDKIHLKQMMFHKSTARNRWVFGGNRSGKTECGAVETVWTVRGIHPYRPNKRDASGWVVSVSYEVQREVAQKKILKYLNPEWIVDIVMQSGKKGAPGYGVIDYIVVKNVFGGESTIGFKSIDQGREKFQGASLDFVWFDEEPPKDIYEECRMRVMDRQGDIFGTMTPLKGLTFIYDEIYLNSSANPEIWHITMEWADNPYLSGSEIQLLSDTLPKDSVESRRYGRFSEAEGLVYKEFCPETHVIDPFDVPREWYDNISIDPGLNNPLSCHFYAVDYDGVIYVIAEHYEKEKDISYHSEAIKRIADSLNWHRDGKGRLCALIDSAASQRTLASMKSVSELLYDNGIIVNSKVNKDIFSGINRVKALFAERPPGIYIFRNCVNLIRELKSYWWGKGDTPIKKDDHALDELRYYVMSKPAPHMPGKRKKSIIELDKEKIIRNMRRR